MIVLFFRVILDKQFCVVVAYIGFTVGVKVPLGSPFIICVVVCCGPLTQV